MIIRLKGLYRAFIEYILLLFDRRQLIWEMARRDLLQRYVGSRVGLLWAVIHPLSLIFIFWFVFGFGLKTKPVADVPFSIWLTAGMAAWFSFSEIVAESTGVIVSNPHLIKKINFPSQILPVVKIVSSMVNHLVFLVLLLIMLLANGVPITFFAFQVIYYYGCLVFLALGISWLTSAINVFVRDVGQIVQLVLQITFWATPIIWNIKIMPEKVQIFLRLNPIYYIIRGYREAFVYCRPFWLDWRGGIYFWCVTLVLLVVGALVFRRLKWHFPDVL
jgi:lipopolysaccharide transport system permease protein/teichoic acid transport system permease protein